MPDPTPSRARTARARILAAAGLAALALGVLATPAPAETLDDPTPTPAAATPTPLPRPTPTPAPLTGPATRAAIDWTAPADATEERAIALAYRGTIDGQAMAHVALLKNAPCPASPIYPVRIAPGVPVGVTPVVPADGAAPTGPGGQTEGSLTVTPRDSGLYSLCGWIVSSPATDLASSVSRFAQTISVGNRASTLTAEIPPSARSGDYFSVKISGTTPGAGRRVLIMAEKETSRPCSALRKAPAGKLALQTVSALPSGDFSKTLRLRYRSRTAGPYLLCAQIVETVDRTPEATAQTLMQVGEGLKCVSTRSALAQRTTDLGVIRKRRDSALVRLNASKRKIGPIRSRYLGTKRASDRRVAAARKAARRAKSSAGRRKARARLSRVRRAETRRVFRAGAPFRRANATLRLNERTYRQYRTGAQLLDEAITRTKKDIKRYCAS